MNFDVTKLTPAEKKSYDFCKSIGMTDEQYQETVQKFKMLNGMSRPTQQPVQQPKE